MTTIQKPYQVQKASLDSYKWLREGGKIGERQLRVFNIFVHYGACSAKMMHQRYSDKYGTISVDGVSPRIKELRDMGFIVAIGKQKCEVTGHMVDFSRAAGADEVQELPISTRAQTKKVLDTSLCLVKLWRKGGSLEAKRETLERMENLLKHFFPDEIVALRGGE